MQTEDAMAPNVDSAKLEHLFRHRALTVRDPGGNHGVLAVGRSVQLAKIYTKAPQLWV